VVVQGFLVGRLTGWFREDVLIVASVVLMGISLLGWALTPSVFWLYVVMTPTALAGGLLNTLISTLTSCRLAGNRGILGLSTAVEVPRVSLRPFWVEYYCNKWHMAPGAFGAVVMTGLSFMFL